MEKEELIFSQFKRQLKGKSKNVLIAYAWKLFQDNIRFSKFIAKNSPSKMKEIKEKTSKVMETRPNELN